MNDFVIKAGIPRPESSSSLRPSITKALRAMSIEDCFDVDYVRRKQLSWCVWHFKQLFPVRQFQTRALWEGNEHIVRCWRLPDVPVTHDASLPLHSFDDAKREEILALEVGYNAGAFVNVDIEDQPAIDAIKQFLDAEVKFPYQSSPSIRRVRTKKTRGILIWRTA